MKEPPILQDSVFECRVVGFDCKFLYRAVTRDKARFKCWRAAHEAGYTRVKFGDITIRRLSAEEAERASIQYD